MFQRLRIVHVVQGLIVLFWLTFIGLAGLAWLALSNARTDLHTLHDVRMSRSEQLAKMTQSTISNRMEVLLMFQHDPAGALHGVHDHAITMHLDNFAKRREDINAAWAAVEAGEHDASEQALMADVIARRKAWQVEVNQAIEAIKAQQFEPGVMAAYLKAGRQENEAFLKALEALRQHQVTAADAAVTQAEALHTRGMLMMIAMALLLGIPGTLASIHLVSRLRRGFAEADATATAIAEGQLGRPIATDGQDEIGELLQHMQMMQSRLQALITQVRQAADSIEVAATEVAAGNTDLSHRTEQTASNLQQTASSAEQLGVTVRQNADNAQQANQLAQSASSVAGRGGDVVSQVVGTMREIEGSSRRIADIIGVIDGIAFQTNILALNAAVEAARAGESGRGFAVVAGEVRNLAQRSADAAREIKGLIQASVERVDTGTRQADEAGQTMAEVVQSIRRVTDIVAEISHASQEQSSGVATVGQAVSQMDEATQQNAALVEQSAAAAESLRAQARQLVQAVGVFKF